MYSRLVLLLSIIMSVAVYRGYGHGAIIEAVGDAGGPSGRALGVDLSTPRDGTGLDPFQQDSSIIRDGEIASGRTGPCGRTPAQENNIEQQVPAMIAELGGLPRVTPGGRLTLTVHQVNADGGGPYSCDLSANGTGNDFVDVEIEEDLGGFAGFQFGMSTTPQPLVVNMPQNMQCTGGPNGNMCLVRCRNGTPAGPFGGCVPVQTGATSGVASSGLSGILGGGGSGATIASFSAQSEDE